MTTVHEAGDILDFDTAMVRVVYGFYKMKQSVDIFGLKNETCWISQFS
jgi:hypothetical protein